MLRVAVLVSGGGTNLQSIIDKMDDGTVKNAKIEVVVSNREDAFALERARKHGILAECISPKKFATKEAFAEALLERFKMLSIDLIVLAGYLVILPKQVIEAYPNQIINVHPSLIPSFCGNGYYGLKVHEAVLKRGVKVTGATVHFVDEGTDTGPILLQKAVNVYEDDTPETLQKRVMEEAEWTILPEAIERIAKMHESRSL